MKSTDWTAASAALLATLLLALPAIAEEWNNPQSGDYFDPLNWTPNSVPTIASDAIINNGGTALVTDEDIFTIGVRNLDIGIDGGEGSLQFGDPVGADVFLSVEIDRALRVGVTAGGDAGSTGRLSVLGLSNIVMVPNAPDVPFQVGVSDSNGDASGRFFMAERSDVRLTQPLSMAQWGVAAGMGSAAADVIAGGMRMGTLPLLEAGVSRGSGSAMAEVLMDAPNQLTTAQVGVAHADGDAEAVVQVGAVDLQGDGSGNLHIGVSHSAGSATAKLVFVSNPFTASRPSVNGYDQVDVGVAHGTGNADAALITSLGVGADALNIGISNGAGLATGLFRNVFGRSQIDTLNLGSGATLAFFAGSPVRAPAPSDARFGYAAMDAETASLNGQLNLTMRYIPSGPTRFELINTAVPGGMSGDFAAVELINLNPGFSWTSGVVTDNGLQKYVVDIDGSPISSSWVNPASGDWFDTANWDSALVPQLSLPTLINNGGEAQANATTASSSMQAFSLGVGIDGGSGSFISDGVDLETQAAFIVGVIQPDHDGGGTATGAVELQNAGYRRIDSELPFQGDLRLSSITVGSAYTSGTGVGSLKLVNRVGTPVNVAVRTGIANVARQDTGAIATAHGTVEISNSVLSGGGLRGARADAQAEDAIADATTELLLVDTQLTGTLDIAEVDASALRSIARSTASVTLTDVVTDSPFDLVEIEATGFESATSASLTANITGLSAGGDFRMLLGSCDAREIDSRVLFSLTDVTVSESSIDVGDTKRFNLSEIETDENGMAECEARLAIVDSFIFIREIKVADVQPDDDSLAIGKAQVSFTDSVLETSILDIAQGAPELNGVAQVDGSVSFTSSTANIRERLRVGFWSRDGSAPGNTLTARLDLDSSKIDTPLLEVGSINPNQLPLNAGLAMRSSHVRTDLLQQGAQSGIHLTIEGITRASPDNLDQPGLYAALDTLSATLAGEVSVVLDFEPKGGGESTYDLITAEAGQLTADEATFRTENLGASTVVSFGIVTEGGKDILRLVLSTPFEPVIFQNGFEG